MAGKINIVSEHFTSINQMLKVIESRENNDIFKNTHSSETGSESFCGTKNWEEAMDLFTYGYKEILPKIKDGVGANLKTTESLKRRSISTGVVGYAPHVPNAILGLPNSMICSHSIQQKVKAITIVYCICENCGTPAEEFVKSGICILNVINKLELSGYRVNLKIMYYCAKENDKEYAFGTIDVKDFKEHLDLQKLCFPIAHPSMFRRFGFKWIETVSGLTECGWNFGYGRTLASETSKTEKFLREHNLLKDNEYFMSLRYTNNHRYNADDIISSMNVK